MTRVLVTDGTYFNTLAIVRCLGKKGIDVIVTSKKEPCIAGVSKYCNKYYIVDYDKEEYKDIIKSENIDVILPVGYNSMKFFSYNKGFFEKYTKVPIVDYDKFRIAGDKSLTYKFASRIGIRVPKTYRINKKEELRKIKRFPVVLKAREETGSVQYANNYKELIKKFSLITKKYKKTPIIQEYIPGNNGYGFYALYWNGTLITYYMHKRLHMFPRSGGPSTMARTYYDRKLLQLGKKVLDKLKWHGVAMVEFKKHEVTGEYYLIEINPKYWGSLDLGIHAGYEMPYYHVLLALGKRVRIDYTFRDTVFMWPENDFRYAISGKNKVLELSKWFINLLNPRIKKHWKINDLRPLIKEGKYIIKKLLGEK